MNDFLQEQISRLDEMELYIKSKNDGYYSSKKRQLIEEIIDEGDGTTYSKWNIKKYLRRYGKKNGYNREDILKIIHYAIFMLISHDKEHGNASKQEDHKNSWIFFPD